MATALKICFVTDSLEPTEGPGRYGTEIIAALKPSLASIDVVLPRDHAPVRDGRLDECRFHRVLPSNRALSYRRPLLPPVVLAAALRLLPIARKADVVHALKDHPHSSIAAIAASLAGKPLVVMAFGTYSVLPLHSRLEGPLLRFAYRKAARIISLGDYTRRRLGGFVEASKVMVIPGGVDFERFARRPREPSGGVEGRFLLSVGQLKERKGFDLCVHAFRRIAPDFPGLRYDLAGDCGDEKYVRGLRDLIGGDGARVRILGRVDDRMLEWLYHHCELFLLTPRTDRAGHFEGFGLVYLEAGACGKAVIGTTDCGAEDAIADGRTGLLVRPDDVDDLARALHSLLSNRDLARTLGEAGRRRAAELSWDRIAARFTTVYRDVLGPAEP